MSVLLYWKASFRGCVESIENKDQVEVEFRSFELNPEAERDINMSQSEMLARNTACHRLRWKPTAEI